MTVCDSGKKRRKKKRRRRGILPIWASYVFYFIITVHAIHTLQKCKRRERGRTFSSLHDPIHVVKDNGGLRSLNILFGSVYHIIIMVMVMVMVIQDKQKSVGSRIQEKW